MGIGKTAQEQVDFTGAAVPAAKNQPFTRQGGLIFGGIVLGGVFGHDEILLIVCKEHHMPAKDFIKENFVLVVGLALPVLLIALFFVVSVIPKSMAVPPQHEMFFTTQNYNGQTQQAYIVRMIVKDGRITARINKTKDKSNVYNNEKLMVYDGKTQSTREIPYAQTGWAELADGADVVLPETKDIKLDTALKAPDGYEFEGEQYYGGGFPAREFFGGSYRHGYRVKKGMVGFKIPENNGQNNYYNSMQFLGWGVK
jgi:hypothetical protein